MADQLPVDVETKQRTVAKVYITLALTMILGVVIGWAYLFTGE